ncbi:MAG: 50S ribosomal protein L30e [Candidatus Micrarchaeota archaeon]
MAEDEKASEEEAGVSTEEEASDEGEEIPEGEAPSEEAPKEKKKKKVVRRRKTKRERENPLTTAVRLAVESGRVEFGSRSGLNAGASGKAKLFVVALNTPKETRAKIDTFSKASRTPVIVFEGSTMELGSVCGRPFPVAVLSVFEEGASNIMELAKKK